MKKTLKKVVVSALLLALGAIAVYVWHAREMNSLSRQLQQEQFSKELINKRIQSIQGELTASKTEKSSLLERIDDLLTEEVVIFDSETILEEIREIGELAAIEYYFTNVGTLDSADKFSFVDLDVPFTHKTAVVTMDGVIKAGIDVNKIEISVDEDTKTIFVRLPRARILSTELFEDSLVAYVEEEELFSNITLEDNSYLRQEIISRAEENALENGLLTQAKNEAGGLIRCLIEAAPSVKEVYTIVIQ